MSVSAEKLDRIRLAMQIPAYLDTCGPNDWAKKYSVYHQSVVRGNCAQDFGRIIPINWRKSTRQEIFELFDEYDKNAFYRAENPSYYKSLMMQVTFAVGDIVREK